MNHSSTATPALLLSKFIDSIELKFGNAEYREINKAMHFSGSFENTAVMVCFNKGEYFYGDEQLPIAPGSLLFIPRGQKVSIRTAQNGTQELEKFDNVTLNKVKEEFSTKLSKADSLEGKDKIISYLSFNMLLYNAIPFFPLLELPAFIIPPNEKFSSLINEICVEMDQTNIGRKMIIDNYLSELVIHLFRHIDTKSDFSKVIEKLQYLTDIRLIDIVKFIQDNLDKELTNAAIAKVAFVSDDYVGQFFKALTGRTLQDYIENRRLDRAMHLLQTSPNSVQEVAAMVGFKDAAYFSRRFKMRFEVNANVIRQKKYHET